MRVPRVCENYLKITLFSESRMWYYAHMASSIADLRLQIIKQGALYIAYSHLLDVSTTGKSEKQAVERFGMLMHIFIQEMIKKGLPDNALSELGWVQRQKRWEPPTIKASALVAKSSSA